MHLTVGSHILTQEKPSGLKAKWTNMGCTGCGRARRRANVAPMCHYMPSTNDTSLTVDDLDGAKELDDEGEEENEEENQDDELLDELDTVIVAAGKTVDQIKMMHALEKTKHANLCNKNRSISAESVKEIATKFGCPSEYTTKLSKLGWIFLNKLQA